MCDRGFIKKSPKWEPTIADRTTPIDVTICDKIIIKTDNDGMLLPLIVYRDDVFVIQEANQLIRI